MFNYVPERAPAGQDFFDFSRTGNLHIMQVTNFVLDLAVAYYAGADFWFFSSAPANVAARNVPCANFER